MKLLLTGATGFVGANLARYFVDHHSQVHILTRPHSDTWRLQGYLGKIHRHFADLRQPRQLKQIVAAIDPQIIIHAAAAGIYRNQHLSATAMIDTNLKGRVNLLGAAQDIPYQAFIHTGSSVESNPKDIYAITKLAATQFAQTVVQKFGRPIIILRLFSPYGPFDDPRRLIPYAITQVLRHQPFHLANPQSVRDYIYITDVVQAYIQAITHASKFSGEVFNVGSGTDSPVKHANDLIIKLIHSDSTINC